MAVLHTERDHLTRSLMQESTKTKTYTQSWLLQERSPLIKGAFQPVLEHHQLISWCKRPLHPDHLHLRHIRDTEQTWPKLHLLDVTSQPKLHVVQTVRLAEALLKDGDIPAIAIASLH